MAAACGGLTRLLAAAALCVLWAALVDARSPAARVHRHLKRLNKPAVKSIEHAIAYVEGDKYYGAKATINVWEPKIQQPNEFSLSQLWILGGSFWADLNSIEAGWQVSPDLYGDNNTKMFTYWTEYVLGYWPSFLFSYLADSASMIEWGGEVVNSEPDAAHTLTQMGSGQKFPEEGFGKACYFKNIQVVDITNQLKAPKRVGTFTEQSNCYDVQNGNNGDWGTYFYYGGPGKNSNCP
ncbi:hypothetical protein ACQ4PT_028361 [Festuca glaucescens]